MRITKRSSNDERRVLIGMIVDEKVLGRISSKWQGDLFKSKYANLIAKWCLKYFDKYGKAPKAAIEGLYETWSERTKDESTSMLVHKLLSSISNEYEEESKESNSDYIIDTAGKYFNRVKIERLMDDVESELDSNETDRAHGILTGYNRLELGVGEGIDLLQNKELLKDAFKQKEMALIKYPGELGVFFSDVLERDSFVSFVGPEGRGKSFWLEDLAFRSISQRKKVAFFEAGDMSQNQIIRRFMVRIARHPRWATTIKYPTRIKVTKRKGTQVKTKSKTFDKRLNWQKAAKGCEKIMRTRIKSKKPYLKLSCHPNSSLHVTQIESILEEWELDGWIPDVIVIDYADILNMDYRGIEGRDKINETWKRLRRLSQTRHCLVVTATQSDAASYTQNTIGMSNFSDDKRKAAHVTAMIGINQNDKEKGLGVMRLNKTKVRDAEFHTKKCVYVAGCLAIGNPAVISCF